MFGVAQSGTSGNFSYSVTGSYSQGVNYPICCVSWADAARFCNWLQNGQPTSGTETVGTTETGAYTMNGDTTGYAETRNLGATYFIPSTNEWYKAAYYVGGGTNAGYWTYPTKSNTIPSNVLSPTGMNNANYYNGGYTTITTSLTPVGSFADSPGPYGTYDMGGNVWQWTEMNTGDFFRGLRGGSFDGSYNDMASSGESETSPIGELDNVGFRVASVPEPSTSVLLGSALLVLGVLYLRRRRRPSLAIVQPSEEDCSGGVVPFPCIALGPRRLNRAA